MMDRYSEEIDSIIDQEPGVPGVANKGIRTRLRHQVSLSIVSQIHNHTSVMMNSFWLIDNQCFNLLERLKRRERHER